MARYIVEISADEISQSAACLQENNLTKNELLEILDSIRAGAKEVDSRVKCHTHCLMKSFGHLDENGKFDPQSIGDGTDLSDIGMADLEKCYEEYQASDDKCEYAYCVITTMENVE
ncbi:general odorant-binding protein 57c-like [Musca domestica]|uniref:General odorant-binding protein 57c-like n=1 Tax=Musca domestica TaxID=7370 RepID=A0A1I8NKN6_MUSDO|nr:general odorant-binding protein 57c-like [Musca domestica]